MSRASRDHYRKKLTNILKDMPDGMFFELCWATHALQSGREARVLNWFEYPREAVTSDLRSEYHVHPWTIETLLNECLATPKSRLPKWRNLRSFRFLPPLVNTLRKLENAESGIMLRRNHVLNTLHLVGHQQFEWQRGVLHRPQLYRSAYIYSGELAKEYFLRVQGFSLDDFTLTMFLLRSIFGQFAATYVTGQFEQFGVSRELLGAVIRLISLPHANARAKAYELRRGSGQTAYKRSLLRTHPCVSFEDSTVAPLPDLVTRRGTTGIFYDVIDGPNAIKNEVAKRFQTTMLQIAKWANANRPETRFQTYCCELLSRMYSDLDVSGEYNYQLRKGRGFDTPDVLIRQDRELAIIGECKATRMSHEARFSEDPLTANPRGLGEMAKGVFQIWRFASHIRRGLLPNERCRTDVRGLILTLEPWLLMSRNIFEGVLQEAHRRAAEKDPDIGPEDRIPVIFCSIEDLEQTVSTATSASLLQAVRTAADENLRGWLLQHVHRDHVAHVPQQNDYPFKYHLVDVLPWWDRFGTEAPDG